MKEYPRFITKGFKPFDPIWLAKETENIACKEGPNGTQERKYEDFYATGVYRGIATGYTVGCCFRCIYCWGGFGRDFPEKYGTFHSPLEVFKKLEETALKYGVKKARISGGAEPTIGKNHLLTLLNLVEESKCIDLFILETNGILFGYDKSYVKELRGLKKVHVRVSLKAGTSEGFTKRTGAIPERFELPYDAIRNLLDYGISFHVAAMTDKRIMPKEEREMLIEKLRKIDRRLALVLEEEVVDPYETTLFRMNAVGVDLKKFFVMGKYVYDNLMWSKF